MLRVGLLGAGRIGQVHAQNITTHKGSTLVAVADVNSQAAEQLCKEHGAAVRTSSEIITDQSIDAVLIATSTDTHADLLEAAVAAGKAVLCEKPVDLDLSRARACQSAVKGSSVAVMMGFNRRFDDNFSALKNSLSAGAIGKPELLTITSFDPAPPPIEYVKVSGGLFRDMTIHDFDMANFLMDELPLVVSATSSSIIDENIAKAGDVDTAVVTMKYADGRIAVIKNSRRAVYGYDQRVELLGSEGMLSAGNVNENSVIRATTQGVSAAKPKYFFLERYTQAFASEWAAFVDAAENGTTPPVGLDDGVAALAMAEAATLSAQTGGPVELAQV